MKTLKVIGVICTHRCTRLCLYIFLLQTMSETSSRNTYRALAYNVSNLISHYTSDYVDIDDCVLILCKTDASKSLKFLIVSDRIISLRMFVVRR